MFMVSFRLKRGKVLLGAAIIFLLAIALMGGRALFGDAAVATAGNTQQAGRQVRVKTNEQRLEFIASFGWEVEQEPIEVMEVIIPKEFDRVYEEYNSMQKRMGYDLSKHAGKRCKRYTYVITNYPGQAEDVRLNLLVRDNRVIGGDIYSLQPDSFMHGFNAPE